MKTWSQRPREIRNLFNPAFCGLVLARAIEGFTAEGKRSMPFSLTLLILPLSLHQRTRGILKDANRSYLTSILQEHPEIRVDLAQRVYGLFPYTMEAFAYLATYGVIEADNDGGITVREGRVKKVISGSQETKDCQTVARALGGKFARINDRATIYTTLGIRP
ncbi:three component ABC system middle component [Ereboglobus luteus]|uniref:Uncharacterized protein n=1 Tax=Ereboglobus luteus TaxID=1796921 RepID=A0A2U8E274_9BACT|nr:three component ABC system middle component [Ereboglobus luteus]AWI08895.1 hypothetical protein CKA38_06190 [Ereboglobus luteus]